MMRAAIFLYWVGGTWKLRGQTLAATESLCHPLTLLAVSQLLRGGALGHLVVAQVRQSGHYPRAKRAKAAVSNINSVAGEACCSALPSLIHGRVACYSLDFLTNRYQQPHRLAATTMSETQSFKLPDGRTLCFSVYGSTEARNGAGPPPTAFYFHGFPSSHHEGAATHEAASSHGLRIIAVSRPGYGGSTNDPGRSILSFPQDVLALADYLHLERFAVMGVSGGGPYVLGCVHSIPSSRLAGAVVVSGMYPTSLGLGGMMLANRVLYNLAPWAPWLVSYMFDSSMGKIARDTEHPGRFRETLAEGFKNLPEEDRETAEADGGKVLDILAKSMGEAFVDGPEGSGCEAKLFGSPWGFELADLPVRKGELAVYHGAKDIHIPARMAQEAVATMKGVDLVLEQEEAHISLYFRRMYDLIGEVKRMSLNTPNTVEEGS